MQFTINPDRFNIGHERFQTYVQKHDSGGRPFNSFKHPYLLETEIRYKWKAYSLGREALSLEKWGTWRSQPGRITEAVAAACHSSVSANLLVHRYGPRGNSASPLYRVETDEEKAFLEEQLIRFFLGGKTNPRAFGSRFDRFADFLRRERLGCNWPFLAYLSFLLDPYTYFNVHPGAYDNLLGFYGIEARISGSVCWESYLVLLYVAESLKAMIQVVERPDAIEVQSYMYIVGRHLTDAPTNELPLPSLPDFDTELQRRVREAERRERIGIMGERRVYELERRRLLKAGLQRLAGRVEWVSVTDSLAGFDVRSFDLQGKELHIEVKTTIQAAAMDQGFYLTQNEYKRAQVDPHWCIYRVWDVEGSCDIEDIGNPVMGTGSDWKLHPASWQVRRKAV